MIRSILISGVVLIANAGAVLAQQVRVPATENEQYGCLGFSYQVELAGGSVPIPSSMKLTGIDSAGPAARAGFRVGDVVTHINGEPITTGAIGRHWEAPAGTAYTFLIARGERKLDIEFVSGRRTGPGTSPKVSGACIPAGAANPTSM